MCHSLRPLLLSFPFTSHPLSFFAFNHASQHPIICYHSLTLWLPGRWNPDICCWPTEPRTSPWSCCFRNSETPSADDQWSLFGNSGQARLCPCRTGCHSSGPPDREGEEVGDLRNVVENDLFCCMSKTLLVMFLVVNRLSVKCWTQYPWIMDGFWMRGEKMVGALIPHNMVCWNLANQWKMHDFWKLKECTHSVLFCFAPLNSLYFHAQSPWELTSLSYIQEPCWQFILCFAFERSLEFTGTYFTPWPVPLKIINPPLWSPPSVTPPGVPAGHSWAPPLPRADNTAMPLQQTRVAGELSSGGSGLHPGSPDTPEWRPSWWRWRPSPPSSRCWAPHEFLRCPSPQEKKKKKVKDNSCNKIFRELQVIFSFPPPTLAGNNPAFN